MRLPGWRRRSSSMPPSSPRARSAGPGWWLPTAWGPSSSWSGARSGRLRLRGGPPARSGQPTRSRQWTTDSSSAFLNVPVVLQWRGRLREEDPDAFGTRLYLLIPITAAFLVIAAVSRSPTSTPPVPGSALCLGALGVIRRRAVRSGAQRVAASVAAPGLATGDDDRRLPPDAARCRPARPGPRYELEEVVGRSSRLLPRGFDDLRSAERAALRWAHVAIIGRRLDRAAVRIVESP